MIVEIVSFVDSSCLFPDRRCPFIIKLDGCCGICFGKIDALQVDKAFGGCVAGLGDALHRDLFDQPFVIGFHCVQPVDHIIDAVGFMGGRIAQG